LSNQLHPDASAPNDHSRVPLAQRGVNRETGEFSTYQAKFYVNIATSDCTEYIAVFERETAYHAHHSHTICGSFSK